MSVIVTVKYPNKTGSKFDMEYYQNHHLPLVSEKFGDAMISLRACQGMATPDPNIEPPFQVMAILEVESIERFKEVMEASGNAIDSDIPNYTDVEPVIQISNSFWK